MSSNALLIKNKSEKRLDNNFGKSKIGGYEEEYECSYSPNKDKNNNIYSSLSFKSDANDQINTNKYSENIDQDFNNKLKDNIEINEKRRIASKKDVFVFADQLYSNDEHLDKRRSYKKKNASQFNLINMNNLKLSNSSKKPKNIQQTAITKQDINQKIKKKSLFHIFPAKMEEEKKNNCLKFRPSLVSKGKSSCNEKKRKTNNFESFFKLKPKMKNPPKVNYIDSVIKNNNLYKVKTFLGNNKLAKVNTLVENNKLSKVNTFVENNNIKRGDTIRAMKGFEKNIVLSPEKNGTKRKEEEKEIKIITKLNTIKMEDNKNEYNINTQIKEEDNEYEEEEKKKNKKFKWTQNFLCCLSSNCV